MIHVEAESASKVEVKIDKSDVLLMTAEFIALLQSVLSDEDVGRCLAVAMEFMEEQKNRDACKITVIHHTKAPRS